MSDNKYLKLGAFFDGRPGHEKQTVGIVTSLQQKISIELVTINVSRKIAPLQVLDVVRYYAAPSREKYPDLADCNLLIGTGTHTHLPMLDVKKVHGLPVVTCMSPASYLQNRFDLIFSPQHDRPEKAANIVETVGPPNPNCDTGRHEDDRVLLLCGGSDPKSHSWNSDEIVACFEKLVQHGPSRKYILSSSPRTPVETVLQLISLADQYDNIDFHDFANTPRGWVEKQYERCAQVWVTADSISMVYEALSSGCRVGIVPVRWRRHDSKFSRSVQYLMKTGRVVDVEDYLYSNHTWRSHEALNEAGRCADEILKRFL